MEINFKQIIKSKEILSVYLFAFIIPFYPKFYSLTIALFLVEFLIKSIIYKHFSFKESVFNKVYIFSILFFVAHVFGMFFTENIGFAVKDIGMKASFLIFPVFFMLFKLNFDWKRFKFFFLSGVLVSIIVAFIFALNNFYETQRIWVLKDKYLAVFMHRSYWSAYINAGSFILLYELVVLKKIKVLKVLMLLLFITTVFLLGSKIMILLLFLTVFGFLIFWMFKAHDLKKSLIIFSSFVLLVVVVVNISPSINSRFTNVFDALGHRKELDKSTTESSAARLVMWSSATSLINENIIFGVGTGDVKDKLKERTIENGFYNISDMNLNAHSQFFNTQLALGLFGSFSLLGMFFFGFFKSSKHHTNQDSLFSSLRIFLGIMFFVSMGVESFLEVQAGIVPFAFLLCLFNSKNMFYTEKQA